MSITTSDRQDVFPRRGASAVRCTRDGCNGEVLRHSLGCGLADRRCTRCFTRYAPGERRVGSSARPRGVKAFLDDLVTWREED
jgi:hypothetical protein